jgi:hypothetical protein
LPLYRQKADYFGALRVTNGKTLTNASKLIATGLQEEEILVDPVTGGIIIDRDLPELIEILLSQYERVWLYAARFEANPAYIDPVESEFLEQNSAAVVYEGRDGVSKVYLLE